MFGRLLRVTGTVLVIAVALGGVLGVLPGTESSAITASGLTVAGGNGAGPAADQLDNPQGVFVNSAGDVYVSDTLNNRVQEWAPGATAGLTVAGGSLGGLNSPEGVWVDGSGNIYVADANDDRVQKWAPGATAGVTVAGGNGAGSAANQLSYPTGLFVDGSGNIYVTDTLNNRVQEWAPGATAGVTVAGGNGEGTAANQLDLTTSIFGPPVGLFSGVAVDGSGSVYVSDAFNNRVQKWAPGATAGVTVVGAAGASTANQLSLPGGLYIDGAGDLYVTDTFNYRIQEYASGAATGVTVAGGNSFGTASNQLTNPEDVSVDSAGNVYVVDTSNNRVQEWEAGPNQAPSVTIQPTSQTITETNPVTFSAAASGEPPPAVQWQQSTDGGSTWSDLSGETSNLLIVTGVPLSDNGDQFRAVFTNTLGSAATNAATLTVTSPPPPTTFVGIPANGATVTGDSWLDAGASSSVGIASVSFEVSGGSITDQVISGSTPTVYGYIGAWNSTSVPNGTYTIQSVATDTVGQSTTSAPIRITVNNPPPSTFVSVPSNGSTQSGTAAVLDAGASADVTSVSYELNGGTLTNQVIATGTATLYGWLAVWNTTSVPNGTYTLQSVGTVAGGGTVTSSGITVTVSN